MTRRVGAGLLALASAVMGPTCAQAQSEPFEPAPVDLPGRLELHRPNYVLPLTWTDEADNSDDIELEFQLSLRHQVGATPFYVAYTQESYLRWLDEENSRPFREINYSPEIWYRFRPGRLPLDWLGLDVGWEHESNGGAVGESRSWDRVYLRPWLAQGRWRGHLRLWYRVPEPEKEHPGDATGDDNPEILDYYGHHELRLEYFFRGGSRLAAKTRYAFSSDRGALQLQYAWPTPTRESYFFLQLFTGYGESLETFKTKRTRVGIGFTLLQ